MDELLMFNALVEFHGHYLGRPGLIEGGEGRVVEVSRVAYQSVTDRFGGISPTLIAFYRFVFGSEASVQMLEILPSRFPVDGYVVPVRYTLSAAQPRFGLPSESGKAVSFRPDFLVPFGKGEN